MKKIKMLWKSGVLTATLLGALAPIANAQLITLSAGNFTITAQGFSASSLSANLADSAPNARMTSGGVLEDTWGIFQIKTIFSGANPVYTDNGTSPGAFKGEYWGMFYNGYDTSVATAGSNIIFSGGGLKLDIYQINVLDSGDSLFSGVKNQGTADFPAGGRLPVVLDGYNGITNAGTKVLSSTLSGSLDSIFNTSKQTTFTTGLLDVTSNNMFALGGQSLSQLTFALSGVTDNVPNGWSVAFGGPITGDVSAVPEPSTYALAGVTGLMCLVAVRRLRSRKTVAA